MLHRRFGMFALVLMVLSGAGRVQAGYQVYTDAASYASATTGNSTPIDFEGLSPDGLATYLGQGSNGTITINGVTFTAGDPGDALFAIGKGSYYPDNSVLSSQGNTSTTTVNSLIITLPTAVTAFGVNFGDFFGNTATFQVGNGDTFTLAAPPSPDLAFAGYTSDQAFQTITISTAFPTDYVLNIDNFQFGTAVTVPEPASLTMLAIGGSGILAGLRRRRSAA